MKKIWFFIPLFIILLWPNSKAEAAIIAEKYEDWMPSCSKLDEAAKKELDEIIVFFENEDMEKIENRINSLLESKKQLEAEKSLVKKAVCYEPILEDAAIEGAFDLYHSLLTYAETIQDEGEQFKELSVELKSYDTIYMLDAVLSESGKEIHIDHFFTTMPGSAFLGLEVKEAENELKKIEEGPPEFAIVLTSGIADDAYKVIQNPVDKALSIILSYLEGQAEKEREIFRNEASLPALSYDTEFSIIEIDAGTRKQELMKEYYPSTHFLTILKRWEAVTHILPELKYPEEAIEKEDWNEVAVKLREYGGEFGIDQQNIYDFILTGNKDYLTDEENRELRSKVENIEEKMQ